MKYYIDFSGYCEVEANSPEEAEEKFWNTLVKMMSMTSKALNLWKRISPLLFFV